MFQHWHKRFTCFVFFVGSFPYQTVSTNTQTVLAWKPPNPPLVSRPHVVFTPPLDQWILQQLRHFHLKASAGWWLNQPLWKICSSKWVHLPQFSGWKFQKYLSCHQPVGFDGETVGFQQQVSPTSSVRFHHRHFFSMFYPKNQPGSQVTGGYKRRSQKKTWQQKHIQNLFFAGFELILTVSWFNILFESWQFDTSLSLIERWYPWGCKSLLFSSLFQPSNSFFNTLQSLTPVHYSDILWHKCQHAVCQRSLVGLRFSKR